MTAHEPQEIVIPDALLDLMPIWAPAERTRLSEWAERHFFLSPEYSAKTGLIELEPGQAEVLDAVSDPAVNQITLMCAVQMFKTLVMQIAAAYFICEDPGPMMFVGSKDDKAEEFSKDRFATMCRDIDVLNARVLPAKSRDSQNTIAHKMFPGGRIDFVGASSKGNLVGKTLRYVLGDEVDVWPANIEKAGDPLGLVRSRLTRFGSRGKMILACSPTVRNSSRIANEYDSSDQRKPYVGCHACGRMQTLRWTNVHFNSGLGLEGAAAGARYRCEKCDGEWTDAQRRRSIRDTFEWRSHADFHGNAGFWINHLYSTLSLHSLGSMTKKFLEGHDDPLKNQVFINEDLAELWEETGERPDHEKIMERAEPFEVGNRVDVHPDVVALFAGVDQQAKRLEVQVLGFGPDEAGAVHTWVVDYRVIELFESDGQSKMTSAPEYWTELERSLKTAYRHPSGVHLPIIAMAVDTGYNPDPVYQFAQKHPRPIYGPLGLEIPRIGTVICIRGHDSDNHNAIHRVTERETARLRKDAGRDLPIVTFGTGFLKVELYSELLRSGDPRVHLSKHLSLDYFRGLVAEKRIVNSKGEIEWKRIFPRNEPLDTWVYARGAFYAFRGDRFGKDEWDIVRQHVGLTSRGEKPGADVRRTVKSSYLG